MGASSGAISTVSGVAMSPPSAWSRARRGSLAEPLWLVDETLVRSNRTPPSDVCDTRLPSHTSFLTKAGWHGGCYHQQEIDPATGGQRRHGHRLRSPSHRHRTRCHGSGRSHRQLNTEPATDTVRRP